jgi:hypothetical protein
MHRRSRFLVGLATAAITFGCLWFTLGPSQFNRGQRLCHPMHHHCMMKEEVENDECCGQSVGQKHEKVILIKEVIKNDSIKK